jgi:hypothetical protein
MPNNDRPQLPPDLMSMNAGAVDLGALRDRAQLLTDAEKQNGRRCSCGKRIWSRGIRAFGFYVGPIPSQIAGIDIPLGNIQVTGVYCSTACESYKQALTRGLEFPGSQLLGLVEVSGYERLPVHHWLEGPVDDRPED